MEIIHHATLKYKADIIVLYIQSFPRSSSDKIALNKYIDRFLTQENAYLAIENSALKGALLYSPLNQDADLPAVIEQNFNIEKSVYIAEMMVSESSRGKGLGTELLESFLNTIDTILYTDAFIRVWDQNQVAIGLYKKMGFTSYTQIDQVKNLPDGSGTFIMKKLYLHKKL